ncbi:MAG: Fic family protein [Bacteroidaceae bacterium]|jgi:Fic family protein|nr:Fic family protein [Bacteroidaceae bacterium]
MEIERLYNEWQRLQPLKDEDQKRLNQKFMLEFNYNSNHLEGNTLTYGQTQMLLLFGKVVDAANMKDLEDMKASNVALKMIQDQAVSKDPLTETFIRQLHQTLLRKNYTVYRELAGGDKTSYTIHVGQYKTRPNSVITSTGEQFDYASPQETPALMTDLVNWYNEEEQKRELTIVELCALFHYRYIRIHPFEDGNGRIARLLVNYILSRHKYPMIVVQSSDKDNYLNALNLCDTNVGLVPSDAAHALIEKISPFVSYIEHCMEKALTISIKAAKGESIEQEDDFLKELKVLEREKKQELEAEKSKLRFSGEKVWDILEFFYYPLTECFENVIKTTNSIFRFTSISYYNLLSKTKESRGGIHINEVMRGINDPKILEFVNKAQSIWFYGLMSDPMQPKNLNLEINKTFHITFFEDHYFVDGILNKNFPYGKYPTEEDKRQLISSFKQDILSELKEKM